MTRQERLRKNEKHCGFDTLRLRRMELFKAMKPSMWYLDENRWEAGQQQIVN